MSISFSTLIRRSHRWVSMLFTFTVVANFVAMTQGEPPALIAYSPLLPLAFLVTSGLYLFALPLVRPRRDRTGPT
jgi:hypothetical protein